MPSPGGTAGPGRLLCGRHSRSAPSLTATAALGVGAYDAYGRAARVKLMSGGGPAPLPGLAGRLCFAWGLSQEEGLPPCGARGSAGAGQAEGAAGREPAPPQFPGRRPAGLQATPEWPALWPTDTHTVCATTHGK